MSPTSYTFACLRVMPGLVETDARPQRFSYSTTRLVLTLLIINYKLLTKLNWLDFLILMLLIAGMVRGYSKGLIFEASGLIGLIIAVYISRYHSSPFASFIHNTFNVGMEYCPALGMVMAFILSLFFVKALAMIAQRFIKTISLGWLNRLLGVLFAGVKLLIVISVLFNVLGPINEKHKVVPPRHLEGSLLYGPVTNFAPTVLPKLKLKELVDLPKNIEDSIQREIAKKKLEELAEMEANKKKSTGSANGVKATKKSEESAKKK